MPISEVLILAVTKMLGGVCIAGMTADRDPVTGLRWVRPVRDYAHVLLGDITTADGQVLSPFDVVALNLLQPRPSPPHTEDWITDFVRIRPCIIRRPEGLRRAHFLRKHLDTAPQEVLEGQQRSLCLLKPEWLKGRFRLDEYSGQFEARLAFGANGRTYRGSYAQGGVPVTDLKWRALGRAWLPKQGGWAEFVMDDLEARLGVQEVYLAVGLSRPYQGACWPMVIGVHTVPDYEAMVDYDNL
jgi:hypothetical protein